MMIEVKNLTKEFGPNKAVSDITFSVGKGEILGFLGPNGAGKTTTMRILAGIFPPTTGSAVVAGFNVGKDSMEIRRRIGYLPEQVPIYPELTVNEYLDFVASVWRCGRKSREAVLEMCGLKDVQDALVQRLSRGYRQRVGLAQALIHDPEVLILDEPTVGLDPKQIRDIRELIKSFAGKKTVILSTHILPEVSMTCQKVVIIDHGKVVAEGTPESLARRLDKEVAVDVEVRGPRVEIAKALSGIEGVADVVLPYLDDGRYQLRLNNAELRSKVARTIVQNNWDLLEMRMREMTLEDVFVKLVTKEEVE